MSWQIDPHIKPPPTLLPQLSPLIPSLMTPIIPTPLPTPTPTPTTPPPQIPALDPYPTSTTYQTYTYSPPAVQMKPLAEVQRAAIDPTLLLLGGIAIVALLFVALRKQ
jgi:hypothetical protein